MGDLDLLRERHSFTGSIGFTGLTGVAAGAMDFFGVAGASAMDFSGVAGASAMDFFGVAGASAMDFSGVAGASAIELFGVAGATGNSGSAGFGNNLAPASNPHS